MSVRGVVKMEEKRYIELKQSFVEYLTEKRLRKTEERYKIFDCICYFSGYFNINELQERLNALNFHVSKATIYNTLDVLVDAGLVVRHPQIAQSIRYELRVLAEMHKHLVCLKCGEMREVKDSVLRKQLSAIKVSRFAQEYHMLYIYGMCSRCAFKLKQQKKK